MAWLSKNTFSPSDALHADDLNNLANDQRAWGGDVNGGGHHLSNVIIDSYIPGGVGQTLLSITHIVPAVGDTSSWLSFDGAPAGSPARWRVGHNNAAESTGNVGSDFAIGRHSDAGVFIDSPISIRRSDGLITMGSQKWTGPIDGGGQTLTNVVIAGGASQTPWIQNVNAAGFQLQNAGRVGIGIAAPAYLLDVRGAATGNTQVHIGYDASDLGGYLFCNSVYGLSVAAGGVSVGNIWTAKSAAFAGLSLSSSSGVITFNLSTGLTPGATFNPTEVMRVAPTGLGIGTTAPAYLLDVRGPGGIAGSQMHVGFDGTDAGGYLSASGSYGLTLSAGAALVANVWTAKSTSAVMIGQSVASAAIVFSINQGLTVGATFTTTEVMRINPAGIQVAPLAGSGIRGVGVDATGQLVVTGGGGGGMVDPTTTKGDLIVHGASGTTRLPGSPTDSFVLTYDSTQALGVKWAAAPGGSGSQTPWLTDIDGNGKALTNVGSVGIRTAPTEALTVGGAVRIFGGFASPQPNCLILDFPAGNYSRVIAFGANTATAAGFQFLTSTSNAGTVVNALTITPAGLLGVNVASPTTQLEVGGFIRTTSIAGLPTTGVGCELGYQVGSANGILQTYDRTAGAYRTTRIEGLPLIFNQNSGGYVGINISPSSHLHVNGNYSEPSLTHAAYSVAAFNSPGTTLALTMSSTSPFAASFQGRSASADAFIIPIALNPLGGNVGIGITTPTAQLMVYGTGQTTPGVDTVSGALGGTLYLKDVSGAASAGGMVIFGAVQGYAFAAIKSIVQDGSNYSLGSLSFSLRQVNSTAALVETMRLDSTGTAYFLGKISAGGFIPPTEAITVAGAVRIAGTLTNYVASSLVTDFALGGGRFWSFGADTATKGTFSFIPVTANGTAGIGTTITATGVGIGNATPLVPLHVYCQAGGPPATSGTSQPNGAARFRNVGSGGNSLDIGAYTTSPFGLWLQGTDQNSLALNYPLVLNPNGGKVQIGPGGIYAPNLRGFNSDTEAGTAGLVQGDFYFNISTGGVYRKL